MMTPCPRSVEDGRPPFTFDTRPDDGTCHYCGSLDENVFMARLEKGDVVLAPTDKNYKVYVRNDGGEPFRLACRTDKPDRSAVKPDGTPDQGKWTWETRAMQETKFYFQHLTADQRQRFIVLLNDKKIRLDIPGRFYVLPFFAQAL